MLFFKNYPNSIVIISCLFWGTYWIPLRYIDNYGGSVWPISISFFLLSLILFKNLKFSILKIIIEKNYYFFLSCFFSALGIALYSESLLRGEISKVVILFYLCPIWGTIFAKIILNINFSIGRIISILLGITGLEIIIGVEKGIFLPNLLSDWLAITAGLSWALGMTFFHLSKKTNSLEKTSLTGLLISLIFFILCFLPDGRNFNIPLSDFYDDYIFIWIILFSLIWLLPSILLTYFSVDFLDPGRINLLLAFEVVIGILSASLLTNEIIGLRQLLGAFFVISSCMVDIFFVKLINNK